MTPIPQGRLLAALTVPLGMLVAGFWVSNLLPVAVMTNGAIAVLLIIDLIISKVSINFSISREQEVVFSIGRENNLAIDIVNRSQKQLVIHTRLGLPESFQDKSKNASNIVRAKKHDTIHYCFRPLRRGSFPITAFYYRIRSISGFFQFFGNIKTDITIEVFPDVKKLNHFIKLFNNDRAYEIGINKNRYKGMGTELESLREYRKDDDSKYIDWKASTRVNKPITKVFQMETNNTITIVLDCGRMMTAEQDGLNTLDHAINALLIFSHIAYRAGDTINIIAFSDRIIGELKGVKGKASIKKITSFITKLEAEFVESNYRHVFTYLHERIKKRSLVIFLTDLIDDINYSMFKAGFNRLSRRHMVLFVLLRDVLLSKYASLDVEVADDLYSKTAAQEMYLSRNKAIARLRYNKINVIDVLPHKLTGSLVNRYLELKSRNRL